tara:strand:+ start:766 stop:996 length:231 start_codon:yes stop_codon:yes gene_type:complete
MRETFNFENAEQLRDFLNMFKETDLASVLFKSENGSCLSLTWEEETLSDKSVVQNLIIERSPAIAEDGKKPFWWTV